MEETVETNFDEGDSHAWLGDGFDEDEEEVQEQEFDYLEDEEEAFALNAMLDLEEADDRQAGEAIQLQLAAFNAFGKAKGKGKGFGKKGFKGKGKGKVVRSQMSIEQRRAKLRDLKAKSKYLRCGGMGHWAGDSGCRFANKPQPPKPTANLAYESESSDDEEGFVYVGAATSNEQTNAAMMAFRSGASGKGSRPRPSQAQSSMAHANDATSSDLGARVTPSSVERPMGFDNVFQIGQFKGKTYWDVLRRQPHFYVWAKKEGLVFPKSSSMCNGLTSSLSSGVVRYTFEVNLFNLPLHCPVAPRKELQRRRRLIRRCPTSVRTARSFRSEGARDTRFVARVCVVGIHPPRKGKRNPSTSLKIARMNPPITGDQAVRLIACGASNVVRSLMNCQWNYAVGELPWQKLLSQQHKVSIIEAITRDDQEVLTPETVGRILGIFSGLVESECSSSPDTLTQA